jgi:hypothetical protein
MAITYLSATGYSNFNLDKNAISVSLPDVDRAYTFIDLFSDAVHVSGLGSIKPGAIQFSKKFTANNTSSFWHTIRTGIMKWITIARTTSVYFNIENAAGDVYNSEVIPMTKSGEGYNNPGISDEINFSFQMKNGYFQKTTAETDTYTLTTTGAEENSITNSGNVSTPPLFTFTPSEAFTLFQIQLNENYGFRLQGAFLADEVITFDCATGQVTIGGNIATGLQTAGSIFKLEPGINLLTVYACPGSLVTTYYERVI